MKSILSAALVIALGDLAVAQDKKIDPVGTWKCEYEIGEMKRTSTLAIKKDGDKLTGDKKRGQVPFHATKKGVRYPFHPTTKGSGTFFLRRKKVPDPFVVG